MAKRMEFLKKGTCYHGNAGIASRLPALAHKKIKPGGVLALVLPLSVANGLAWQGFREMIDGGYTDMTVLSIAANGPRYVLLLGHWDGGMPGGCPQAQT